MSKRMIVLMLGAVLFSQASAVELLTNGNFNDVTGGVPDGWFVYIENPGSAWFTMQSTFSPDGSPTATMYLGEAAPGVVLGQDVTFPFEPNTVPTLNFSCLVNTQWSIWGDAIVEMTFSEPNDTYVSYDQFIVCENNQGIPTTWTAYTHSFAVPAKAGKVRLVLRGSDWIKGLYWDNVSLSYVEKRQAELLSPANYAAVPWEDPTNCGNGIKLHWDAAEWAAGDHYIYLGTSEQAVIDATTSDPEFVGTAPLNDPNFVLSLADVARGQTYYWRVDETTDIGVVKGSSIGQFTVSLFTDIAIEPLQIAYDNTVSPYYTETPFAAAGLACSTDWTRGGNQLLVLDVKGHDNMADSVYVTLESNNGLQSGTVQYGDERELNQQSYEWSHFWPIDLQEFADQGVVLTNVTKIIVGVGNRIVPAAGGSGTVLIDNIRLSSAMCLRAYTPADINSDCVVDIYDLLEISNNWLSEGYTVTQQAPARGPVLWYAFDEGSGTTAADSSGYGYNGTLSAASWGGAGSGVNGSNCLNLNNSVFVQVPIGAANIGDPAYPVEDPNQYLGVESTICFWVKDPGQSDTDSTFFMIGPSDSLQCWLDATGKMYYDAGAIRTIWTGSKRYGDDVIYTNPGYPQDQWVHYAFVKDYDASDMRIYQNGKLVAEAFNDSDYSPVVDGIERFFAIGAWQWSDGSGGYVDGLMDDFRVYDYALSDAEVLSLAATGGAAASPMYQPLIIPADVTGDNTIDLEDFAGIAQRWLEQAVYPE
ncbi:MAG: LamG domain-containing protein [Planctomycetaceae bacterium]|nr:LamG domain-containing protein [Planctomycetaceae bacterium]